MEPAEKVDAAAAETKVEAHEAADNEHERRAAKALAEGSFDEASEQLEEATRRTRGTSLSLGQTISSGRSLRNVFAGSEAAETEVAKLQAARQEVSFVTEDSLGRPLSPAERPRHQLPSPPAADSAAEAVEADVDQHGRALAPVERLRHGKGAASVQGLNAELEGTPQRLEP